MSWLDDAMNVGNFLPWTKGGAQIAERDMLNNATRNYAKEGGGLTEEGLKMVEALRNVVENGQSAESQPLLNDLTRSDATNWLLNKIGGGRGKLTNREVLDRLTELNVGSLDPKVLKFAKDNNLLYKQVKVQDAQGNQQTVEVRRGADELSKLVGKITGRMGVLEEAGVDKAKLNVKKQLRISFRKSRPNERHCV